MKNILIGIVLISFIFSLFAKYLAASSASSTEKMELEAKRYNALKSNWGDKNSARTKLMALSDDLGTKYFSATVSQKQINGNLFSISFLVLNSDEFDAIMQRIIEGPFQIKKLEITNNEAAYLIVFEALI